MRAGKGNNGRSDLKKSKKTNRAFAHIFLHDRTWRLSDIPLIVCCLAIIGLPMNQRQCLYSEVNNLNPKIATSIFVGSEFKALSASQTIPRSTAPTLLHAV